jgi:hypothetical protein
LNDIHIVKALTLNVLTSGYDMEEGSRPFAIVYRICYKLLKTSLDPRAVGKNSGNSTLLIQSSTQDANMRTPKMIEIDLPNEWLLENVSKLAKVVNDTFNLDYIQQYLDGYAKISFANLNLSNRIERALLINERMNSFAGSTTIEGLQRRDEEVESPLSP